MSPLPQKLPTGEEPNKPAIVTKPEFSKPVPPIGKPEFSKPVFSQPTVVSTTPVEEKEEEIEEEFVYEKIRVEDDRTESSFSFGHKETVELEEPPALQADDEDDEDDEEILDPEELEELKRAELIESLSQNAKESAMLLLTRISDDKCSEVLMNGPTQIMVKENGNRMLIPEIRFDSVEEYHTVINALILHDTDTKDRIGTDTFLIEGQLELPDYDDPDAPPLFARVHVLTPPVVQAAKVTIAKKAKRQFRVDDLVGREALSPNMAAFLKALARGKATIVFSGLSGAGKTTLLESLSYEFDSNDRVVVIEDTAELRLPVYDVVPLLATSKKPGQDSKDVASMEWLVAQANRMRPDRIIVGESRGGEFAEFLTAANSGADGSMTTIHASSTKQAVDKMRLLAMKSSNAKNETSVLKDISSSVQIIVQMALIDGKHIITQIDELSDVVTANGGIGMQPIFEYDRNTNRFKVIGKPSEKLSSFLHGRGVTVDASWFQRI